MDGLGEPMDDEVYVFEVKRWRFYTRASFTLRG